MVTSLFEPLNFYCLENSLVTICREGAFGRGCGRAMVLDIFCSMNSDDSRTRACSVFAVGAGGAGRTFFSPLYLFFFSSPLWETARFILEYNLKEQLIPQQQPIKFLPCLLSSLFFPIGC